MQLRQGEGPQVDHPPADHGLRPARVYGGGQMVMSAALDEVSPCRRNSPPGSPFIHGARRLLRGALPRRPEGRRDQVFTPNDDSQMTTVEYFNTWRHDGPPVSSSWPAVPVASRATWARRVDLVKTFSQATGIPIPVERDPIEYVAATSSTPNEKLKRRLQVHLRGRARRLRDTGPLYQQEGWI